jgi:tryptophan synthase alpha chain
LGATFRRARDKGRAAFVAYVTCGDPTLERTKQLVRRFADSGVDVVEFGVPFSDPTADGVANQEAANRALAQGVTLGDVLRTARELRAEGVQLPIVLFTYYNPVFAYGVERLAEDAAAAGVDGVLLVDVPAEEADDCWGMLRQAGLATIFLAAPTTDEGRLVEIVRRTSGFLYYVSRTGVTGERESLRDDIRTHVEMIRRHTDLPIAVGFGISTPEHVREVASLADGVIVGSAIVRRIGAGGDTDEMVKDVSAFVRSLTEPLGGRTGP